MIRLKHLPILGLSINLPYFEIKTELMNELIECRERSYVLLHIKIYKWNFSFELYDTYNINREAKYFKEVNNLENLMLKIRDIEMQGISEKKKQIEQYKLIKRYCK